MRASDAHFYGTPRIVEHGNNVNADGTFFGMGDFAGDWWDWLDDSLSNQFRDTYYNGDKISRFYNGGPRMANEQAYFLGNPRLRQLRVKNHTCTVPTMMRRVTTGCQAKWSKEYNENSPYAGHNYSTSKYTPFWGQYGDTVYDGVGYSYMLPASDGAGALEIIKQLKENLWIDELTRLIVLEFNVYLPGTDRIITGSFATEFTPVSTMPHQSRIHSFKLHRYAGVDGWYIISCEVVLVVVWLMGIWYHLRNLRFFIKRKGSFYEGACEFFKDPVTTYDAVNSLAVFVGLVLHIHRIVYMNEIQDRYTERPKNDASFFNGWLEFRVYDGVYRIWSAGVVTLATMKFIVLFRHNTKVKRLIRLFYLALVHVSMSVFIIAIIVLAYAFAGNLAFGAMYPGFKTVSTTAATLFSSALGSFEYNEAGGYQAGFFFRVYFFSYGIVMTVYMLNIFVAILSDCHALSLSTIDEDPLDMWVWMKVRFSSFFGLSHPRKHDDEDTRKREIGFLHAAAKSLDDLDSKMIKMASSFANMDHQHVSKKDRKRVSLINRGSDSMYEFPNFGKQKRKQRTPVPPSTLPAVTARRLTNRIEEEPETAARVHCTFVCSSHALVSQHTLAIRSAQTPVSQLPYSLQADVKHHLLVLLISMFAVFDLHWCAGNMRLPFVTHSTQPRPCRAHEASFPE